MGDLIEGDDGSPAEEVGRWATAKHEALRQYIGISHGVRARWIGPSKGGATYIDLFCGTGRARIRKTGAFVDGGCVVAWLASVRARSPFTEVIIADADAERRSYAAKRLRKLNAPVVEIEGNATEAAIRLDGRLSPHSLHFAFLDPYSLGAFEFRVVEELARYKYIDMLVHISKMDLQRNTGMNVRAQQSAFDRFAPNWRNVVNLAQKHSAIRREVFDYWRTKVAELGISTSSRMKLVTGDQGQHLYWLTLVARHRLAHEFWETAANSEGQGSLF